MVTASVLPFVSYSSMTETLVPAAQWPFVYSSLQALKGHVQEYPGCQGFDVFVGAEAEGDVLVQCYTTWDTAVQLEAFLERGYTFERMLADIGSGLEPRRSLVMEKVF
jgi:hypothetical protein